MIDRDHELPITRQAKVLNISRGTVYYLPQPVSPADQALMRILDELHLEYPFLGARMLREFKEYRPYKAIEQFRKEIGKYVSAKEVSRLERYVTIQ